MKKMVGLVIALGVLIVSFMALGTVAFADENTVLFDKGMLQSTVSKGTVNAALLAVRSNPGSNYSKIGAMPRGTEVDIIEQRGDWYNITNGETMGWVYGSYIKQFTQEEECLLGAIEKVSRGGFDPRERILEAEIDASEAKGEEIIAFAQNYLGKPYRSGAAGPNAFDCSGFTYFVFGAFDMTLPRTSGGCAGAGTSVSMEDAIAGDLIVFGSGSRISHVGIYMGDDKFIHSASSCGITITSIWDKYWNPKIRDFRRVL